jgi:uncharacterized DUF497 family protein
METHETLSRRFQQAGWAKQKGLRTREKLAGDLTFRIYTASVRISYDPVKRDWTLFHRGLDFEDAAQVFDGLTAEVEDTRKDYGETRIICFGVLQKRLVVVGYTPRGAVRHVFSMRKANDREQARFAPYFGL